MGRLKREDLPGVTMRGLIERVIEMMVPNILIFATSENRQEMSAIVNELNLRIRQMEADAEIDRASVVVGDTVVQGRRSVHLKPGEAFLRATEAGVLVADAHGVETTRPWRPAGYEIHNARIGEIETAGSDKPTHTIKITPEAVIDEDDLYAQVDGLREKVAELAAHVAALEASEYERNRRALQGSGWRP